VYTILILYLLDSNLNGEKTRVVDPKLFISDPYPDPDPTFQSITDPDPTYQVISDPYPDPGQTKVLDPGGSGSATLPSIQGYQVIGLDKPLLTCHIQEIRLEEEKEEAKILL